MLDQPAVFQIHLPARDHVTTFVKFVTCEVAIGERLFELFPCLDVVGRLPPLDLLGDRRQFIAKLLARVLLNKRPDLLEEQARVVRLVARGLASLDAAQLALVDEILEFLVGRTLSRISLFADPIDGPRFTKRLGDRSNTVAGVHRLSPRLAPISRGFGHVWHR